MRIAAAILLLGSVAAGAQSGWQPGHAGIGFAAAPDKQSIKMISSPDQSVSVGRQSVALEFAIQPGLHINSHTPHTRFLISTTLEFAPQPGVEISRLEYPAGTDYHFEFSPQDAVSVYTGEFAVKMRLHVRRGTYALHGQLHYQACDVRSCNPPRSLPVALRLTVR